MLSTSGIEPRHLSTRHDLIGPCSLEYFDQGVQLVKRAAVLLHEADEPTVLGVCDSASGFVPLTPVLIEEVARNDEEPAVQAGVGELAVGLDRGTSSSRSAA